LETACGKFSESGDDIFSAENAFIQKKVIAPRSAISILSISSSKSNFLESHKFALGRFAQFPAV
jgi:hypothetical protein